MTWRFVWRGVLVAIWVWALAGSLVSAQGARAAITAPENGATVRGEVRISGVAVHPDFQRYELYFAPWPPPPSDQGWIFIGEAHFNPQPGGLLGLWDTRGLADGPYALRLRVVRRDGNYIDSQVIRVEVANTVPTPTPTPTETPTPRATPTPVPTPTPAIVALPPIPTPTPVPTVTPVPGEAGEARVGTAGSNRGLSAQLSTIFDGQALRQAAWRGARYSLLAFGLWVGYEVLKRILLWVWVHIRP